MPAAEAKPIPPPEEQRSCSRGPSGSSFVPGLVHELRNFIFGLSGSLEAMQARLGKLEEAAKYQTVMRASLDRLGAFVDELNDYGAPRAMVASRNASGTKSNMSSVVRATIGSMMMANARAPA